jgi:hypothetical protein
MALGYSGGDRPGLAPGSLYVGHFPKKRPTTNATIHPTIPNRLILSITEPMWNSRRIPQRILQLDAAESRAIRERDFPN